MKKATEHLRAKRTYVVVRTHTNLTRSELTEPLSKIPHLSVRAKMSSKKLNYSTPSLWHDKDEAWQEAIPKVHRRVLANSQVASLALFRLDAGAVIPTHSHPHAQHGVCLEGTGEFTIGDQTWKISKGTAGLFRRVFLMNIVTTQICLV